MAIALGVLAPLLVKRTGSLNQNTLEQKIRKGEYWGSGQLTVAYSDVDNPDSLLLVTLDPTKELLAQAYQKYPNDLHLPKIKKIGETNKLKYERWADLPTPYSFAVYEIERLEHDLEDSPDDPTLDIDGFVTGMDNLILSLPWTVSEGQVPSQWKNIPPTVLQTLQRLVEIAKSNPKYHSFVWDLSMMGTGSTGVNTRKNMGEPVKLIDLMMPIVKEKPISPEEVEMFHADGIGFYDEVAGMPDWKKSSNERRRKVYAQFAKAGIEPLMLIDNRVPNLYGRIEPELEVFRKEFDWHNGGQIAARKIFETYKNQYPLALIHFVNPWDKGKVSRI